MVFNLLFVLSEDFYLLYLIFLGRNSWLSFGHPYMLGKEKKIRERKRKEKKEKGKERERADSILLGS